MNGRIQEFIQEEGMMEEACHQCGSIFLDWIGTEYYCLSCNGTFQRYAHQLKAVPQLYLPNTHTPSQQQRKIQKNLTQFVQKYRSIRHIDDMVPLQQRMMRMREEEPKGRQMREMAAVVVYMALREEIGLSVRQYCRANHLKQKSFNQQYKRYHAVIEKERQLQLVMGDDGTIKIEIGREEPVQEKEKLDESGQVEAFQRSLTQCCRALQGIYSRLFHSYYLKSKMQLVVSRLSSLLQATLPGYLLAIDFASNSPHKMYYTLWGLMKWLGVKVTFKHYQQAVREETGCRIGREVGGRIGREYLRWHRKQGEEEEGSGWWDIKVEENRVEGAGQRQEMVFEEYISEDYHQQRQALP